MSYDLYFYRKNDNPLSKEEIQSEFKKMIPIDISEVENQIHYENERTGVYFLIDINEPNTEKEDIEIFDQFDGFENTDLSASINFLRPDYFGQEIFPIIGKISEKLNLYIFNPQEFDKTKERPVKWTSEKLTEHWTDHNSQVSKQQFKELNLKYYPKDKSDKIWNYTSKIEILESEMEEDIYIPNLFMIMNKNTNELFTYVVWSQSIPLILPKVDFIILVKNYKRFFKNIEEIGIVKYETIISKFSTEFEKFEKNGTECLILRQKNADKIKREFNSFPIWKTQNDFGPQIGFDSFVNHRD